MATYSIDFIDKDNAWRLLLSLLKHIPHSCGTNADEHLDKVGTGN